MEDTSKLGTADWRERIQNRKEWSRIVDTARILPIPGR